MTTSPVALLTNDDGHGAAGISIMRRELEQHGLRVVTIAPTTNHTAGSHRVTALRALHLRRLATDEYLCAGTPADCIRVGILSDLMPPPAIVVSGINHGANAGEDIHYSGTVAAAAEAALLAVPAIAVSQNGDGPELPFLTTHPERFPDAGYAAEVALWLARNGAPEHTFINLNLPTHPASNAAMLATIGRRAWTHAAVSITQDHEDDLIVDPWASQPPPIAADTDDYEGLRQGRATISLLSAQGGLTDVHTAHPDWVARLPLRPFTSEPELIGSPPLDS